MGDRRNTPAPGASSEATAGNRALLAPEPLLPESALDPGAAAEMRTGETLLWTGWTSTSRKRAVLPAVPLAASAVMTGILAVQTVLFPDQPVPNGLGWAAFLLLVLTVIAMGAVAGERTVRVPVAISDRRILLKPPGSRHFEEQRYVDPLFVIGEDEADGSGNLDATVHNSLGGNPPLRLCGIARVREVERALMATLIRQGGREAADVWGAPAQVLATRVRAGLDSAHPEPRRKALACLLRLDPSRLEEVARQLGDDSDVITALGIVGMWRPLGKQGARILLCRFEQGSPWRVGACRQAMRRLGQSALRELIQVWKDVAEEVPARSFSWAGRDALAGALAGALLTDDRANAAEVVEAIGTPALRRQIVGTWLAQGDPAADRLLALVRGGLGDRPRWWAAEALGLGAEGGRAERLRAALADEDAGDLATAVIRAHLGDAAGLDAVVRQLEHHDDDACQVCAEALARLGAPAAPAVRALKQALALSTDQETRQAVREAMDRIQRSLGAAPTELEAASAPAGSGTELEAMAAPDGSGSEPEGGAVPGQAGRAATAPARLPERPDSSGRPTR